jgi:hypothetical protein
MKLLGIISVGFHVTDLLLIIFLAFVRYFRKKLEYSETVRQLLVDFEKAYDSVMREVLYSILIQFGVSMELNRLIETCLNETYFKVHTCKYLCDAFLIRSGLKQGDVLSSLLFKFVLGYISRKVQETQVGLKLNGTQYPLVYSDCINSLGNTTNTIKKFTEIFTDVRKELGLEANRKKTEHIWLSRRQNVGQDDEIKIANRSCENVTKLKYLGTKITNHNLIRDEIKERMKSGNDCPHSAF